MYNDDLVPGFDSIRDDNLKITLQSCAEVKDGIVLVLNGYVDTYNSSFFREQIIKVVEAGFINLMFDCAGLKYVSSTGIGVFSLCLKDTKVKNGDIILFALQPTVAEIFQLLGFSQLFNIKNSFDEALAFSRQGMQASVSIFPKVFACPMCSKRLRTACAGRFRCSECKSILTVDAQGQVSVG